MDNVKKYDGQSVNVIGWRELTLDNVKDISTFDGSFVALDTEDGVVCVDGVGLKINSLEKVGGKISVSGEIKAVYKAAEEKRKSGIFGGWFK